MRTILFIFLLLGGLSCGSSAVQAQSKILLPDAFEAMLKNDPSVQLIDVRTPEEYRSGYIAGARNLNIYDAGFAQSLAALDKSKPVLVYCAKGGRSASAAGELQKAGFSQVYDLEGGISAWKAAGKQTEK